MNLVPQVLILPAQFAVFQRQVLDQVEQPDEALSGEFDILDAIQVFEHRGVVYASVSVALSIDENRSLVQYPTS